MRRVASACLVLATLALACGAPDRPRGAPGEDGRLLPDDRLALPQYDLATFRAMIEELRGTPVVVNFWGSWCPPCRLEAPELAKVSREFHGEVQFVGVNFLESRADARDFILEHDWQYPSIYDPRAAIRDGLGYIGQPITIIYDANGEVSFEWVGAVSAELLRNEIRKVL